MPYNYMQAVLEARMSFTTWTIEQILSLAHDHSLVGAAESVTDPAKWSALGHYEGGVWGEFDNRDKPAYHTLAALPNLALSCNCPSRKYPCRHSLSLALMLVRSPELFGPSTPPIWIENIQELPKRNSTTDQETFQHQLNKAQTGLEAYALWLHDMVHAGLAGLPKKPAHYWVTMANRLADNGLFKLALEVRQLSSLAKVPKTKAPRHSLQLKRPSTRAQTNDTSNDWPAQILQRISRHYLIAQGFSRYQHLSRAARADLRYAAGWFTDPCDSWPETVRDRWLVIGGRQEMRQNENIHHAWLWGLESARFALLSRPIPRFDINYQPFFLGATADATMHFYPGVWPFRAHIGALHNFSNVSKDMPPITSLKKADLKFSHALSANPWLDTFPCALGKIDALREEGLWFLRDQEGYRWPLPTNYVYGWHLVSLLAQEDAILFGEWNGRFLTPLSIRENGRWLPMHILRGVK